MFTSLTGDDRAHALVLQSDGKLVAGGVGADLDFALARYLSDGTLDTGFGVAGRVTTKFDPGNVNINQIKALAVREGKIVAAGSVITGPIDDLAFDMGLTRYRHDGTLDTRFGVAGRVTTDFVGDHDQADALAVQADGRLVAAGHTQTGDTPDFALARYRNN